MRRRPCSRAPPNSNPSAPTPTRPEICASPGRQAHLSHTDADADALLWAARSAVACPGCPWERGLARWLRASPPMVVHPGSTQLSGFEVRFLVSGPRQGLRPSFAPPAAGIRSRAEAPRRQPADAVAADAATPPPTPPPTTPTTSTPSPPRPSPSPPPPAMESIECTVEPC